MKDLKISRKLYVILVISVIASIAIAAISMISLNNLSAQTKYINEFMVAPLNTLVSIQKPFDLIRIKVRDCTIYEDKAIVNGFKTDAENAYGDLVKQANGYLNILKAYNVTEGEEYENIDAFIKGLPAMRNSMEKIIDYSLKNDLKTCATLLNTEFATIADQLAVNVDKLAQINEDQSIQVAQDAEDTKSVILTTLMIVVSVVIILLLLIILYITGLIVKPIKQMVEASNNLANGSLNMNLASNAKDETGDLARSMSVAVNTINSLISDLSNMAVFHNEKGEIDYFVDSNKYKGAYSEVIIHVNEMVEGHIDTKKKAMACLGEMAGGNFDVPMEKLPGKKVFINEAIEGMRQNIKGVGFEINALTKEALAGNLSVRARSENFKGDWSVIMAGLNDVLTNITEPVLESSRVLQEVAKGNLGTKVKGDFKGDLAVLSDALNSTTGVISAYIKDISYVLGEVSLANLNINITREYIGDFGSIKESMSTIIEQFNEIIGNIITATEQVNAGARSISESSMMLATGATEQASSIQELSTTIDTINEKTRMNAESARTANDLSESSKKNAQVGNEEMNNMLQSMNGIKESSNNISRIIRTIEDIAFQTNLLALNAAVEAARAGEHGKGFAVVAEEVRILASRSQIAAKETATLIEDSIMKVGDGTKIAQATAHSLETIVRDVSEVSKIISEIDESSSEQALAVSQITLGVGQISEVVQNNSATSEEAASASQELSSQSETLNAMVSRFKLRSN